MRVNLGGEDRFMAQHILNGLQISAAFEQVRRKGMPESVWAYNLLNPRFFCCFLYN